VLRCVDDHTIAGYCGADPALPTPCASIARCLARRGAATLGLGSVNFDLTEFCSAPWIATSPAGTRVCRQGAKGEVAKFCGCGFATDCGGAPTESGATLCDRYGVTEVDLVVAPENGEPHSTTHSCVTVTSRRFRLSRVPAGLALPSIRVRGSRSVLGAGGQGGFAGGATTGGGGVGGMGNEPVAYCRVLYPDGYVVVPANGDVDAPRFPMAGATTSFDVIGFPCEEGEGRCTNGLDDDMNGVQDDGEPQCAAFFPSSPD
jgi:hypothetical protein